MPIKRVQRSIHTSLPSNRQRPVISKWKGVQFIRKHSFIAAVKEIISYSNEMDYTSIGLIGQQGHGKTTLAHAIAHVIHTESKFPFTIKLFTEDELMDFENTLTGLAPANYIMIFDDVSFLNASASKKQIDTVKQALTKIRHLANGQDVKIITILNYHYSLGLDKFLRQSNFKFFTTVGSSENDNVDSITGGKYMKLIKEFQQKQHKAIVTHKIPYRIGSKEIFVYRYRDPFIIVLFYNTSSLRTIISPTREWMEKLCSKCLEATGNLTESEISIPQFMEEAEKQFGVGGWKAAVKLALYTEGMLVYNSKVVRGLKYLNKCRNIKQISLEQCAKHYGLTVTKTKLTSKLDGVMSKDITVDTD